MKIIKESRKLIGKEIALYALIAIGCNRKERATTTKRHKSNRNFIFLMFRDYFYGVKKKGKTERKKIVLCFRLESYYSIYYPLPKCKEIE
jgi:hypothetical protein